VVKGKRNVKKKTSQVEITPELVVEPKNPDALPNFSDEYVAWERAAGKFKLNTGRTSTNILEFIGNMGKVGRAQADGSKKPAESPLQQYLAKAKNAGKKGFFTPAQIQAVADLQTYLQDAMNSPTSKVNPANIKFNDITSYDQQGKILGRRDIFGDFRTPKYVKFQRRHKDRTVERVPSHYYNTKAGKAKPPVWQALFGDGGLDFKHPSLLQLCKEFTEAIPKAEFINTPQKPLRLEKLERGAKRGVAAKWVYENLSAFKSWFDSKVRDPAYTFERSGNFLDRKVHKELIDEKSKTAKISFKLSDAESEKLLAWLGSKVKLDLDNVYLSISRRQLRNMAEIAGFKNKKTEEKVEKQDFSDWREIIKAV